MLRNEFMEWIEDPGLERVLVHEKMAMNGSMPYTKTFRKHVVHPVSLDAHESFGAPATVRTRRRRAIMKEALDLAKSREKAQHQYQEQLAYAETDAALINLGGGVKSLGKAMKIRSKGNIMPRVDEVWSRITLGPAFEKIEESNWERLQTEYLGYKSKESLLTQA
jgi:hypothetical protein